MGFLDIFSGGGIRTTPDGQYIRGANSGGPVVINKDIGGDYRAYVDATERLRATGAPVIAKGACISGCTLALSLPKSQVRVSPDAKFMIHGAYDPTTGAQVPSATADMVGRFQPEVQDFIKRHGGVPPGRRGGEHRVITGRDLIAMGWPSTEGPNLPATRQAGPPAPFGAPKAAPSVEPQVIYADGHRGPAPRSERPAPVTASFDPTAAFRNFWAGLQSIFGRLFG